MFLNLIKQIVTVAFLLTSAAAIAVDPEWRLSEPGNVKQQLHYESNASNQYLDFADIDGDGLTDVLIAKSHPDKLVWLKNNGDGTYSSENIITNTLDRVWFVKSVDIDNDGDFDVIGTASLDNKISLFVNDGSGTFGNEIVVADTNSQTYQPYAVATLDVDKDGDLDIAAALYNRDEITWYENTGDNTFGTKQVIDSNIDGAHYIISADFNNDGYDDLAAVGYYSDSVYWYKNNQNGTFTKNTLANAFNGATHVAAADLDNDGLTDLVATSELSDTIVWFQNNGSNSFSGMKTISTAIDGAYFTTLEDLNADGHIDILAAARIGGDVVWLENLGDGSSWSAVNTISTTSRSVRAVYYQDINNDGLKDVVSSDYYDDAVSWYSSVLVNDSSTETITNNHEQQSVVYYSKAYDADADTLTYSISGADADDFSVDSNGNLSFVNTPLFQAPTDSDSNNEYVIDLVVSDGTNTDTLALTVTVIDTRDTDNDGITNNIDTDDDNDQVPDATELTNGSDPYNNLSYLDTDEDGVANYVETLNGTDINDITNYQDTDSDGVPDYLEDRFGGEINVADAVDSDGDGVSDYVEAYPGKNDAPTWLDFSYEVTIESLNIVINNHTTFSDLDSDGDLDIFQEGIFYENLGSSSFQPSENSLNASFKYSLFKDLNGDSFPDVAFFDPAPGCVTVCEEDALGWFENSGNFSFSATLLAELSATSSQPTPFATSLIDYDSDQDLDLLAIRSIRAGTSGDTIYRYKNSGDGIFTNDTSKQIGHRVKKIINPSNSTILNSQLFFIGTEGTDSTKYLYSLTGFTVKKLWTGVNPRDVKIVDIDDDGDFDGVILNQSGVSIDIILNDGNQNFTLFNTISTPELINIIPIDYNRDGDIDIAAMSSQGEEVSFYKNNTGLFELDSSIVFQFPTNENLVFKSVDIDKHNHLEFLTSEYLAKLQRVKRIIAVGGNSNWKYDVSSILKDRDGNNVTVYISGEDSEYVEITSDNKISFLNTPLYSLPIDHNSDNTYEIVLTANDGQLNNDIVVKIQVVENIDSDGDGTLDYFDEDDDNDQVPDATEIIDGTSTLDPNEYLDNDRDLVPDYIELINSTAIDDPLSFLDTDADGVPDYVENRDNTDINDTLSFLDQDTDGVPNYIEAQQGSDVNDATDYPDVDNDGVSDYQENLDSTDINDFTSFKDTDGDGVPDILEAQFGGDVNVADAIDTDGNGVSDYLEAYYGVNDAPVWKDVLGETIDVVSLYHPQNEVSVIYSSNATDADGQVLNYSLSGVDSALFSVSETGALNFINAPVFSAPEDVDLDNSYQVTITASDGELGNDLALTIEIVENIDTDSDGVIDYLDADDDNDQVPDVTEIENETSPIDSSDYLDTDGDLVPDYIELQNSTLIDDPSSYLDTDSDGVADYIEQRNETDISDASSYLDSDLDGVPDYVEGQQGTDANNASSYLDTDNDGVSNYQETIDETDISDSLSFKDTDGDGVPDYVETLQSTDVNDNTSYLDTDSDFVPDYLESTYAADINVSDALDSDSDGVIDYIEVTQGTDVNDASSYLDTDSDLVPDHLEFIYGSDINVSDALDSDGDGVIDYIEVTQGTDINDASSYLDTDSDGVSDYQETIDETDKNDSTSSKDTDGDGVPDSLEAQFGGDANVADAVDSDGDGVSDYIEAFPGLNDAPVWKDVLGETIDVVSLYHPQNEVSVIYSSNATDADGQVLNYSLSGVDSALFSVSETGALNFINAPVFSAPEDVDLDNSYQVTITASDGELGNDLALTIEVVENIDTDGDGVLDYIDEDDDNDLVPDANELIDGTLTLDANDYLDSDGDLVPDYVETFDGTTTSDATSYLDTDDDTVPDYIETRDGTDINNAQSFTDTDSDGVPNYVETRDVTDASNGSAYLDSDNDGVSNYQEAIDTTDVNDATSFKDTDLDGVPDALEAQFGGDVNVADAIDTDGNGVSDYLEAYYGVNDAPVWKDVLGETIDVVSLYHPQNEVSVIYSSNATDADGQVLNYSLSGVDSALFSVSETGALNFINAPVFSAPEDVDLDNSYQVTITASDGELGNDLALTIEVVENIDTDGDGVLDYIDEDDDNDLVPDANELIDGTLTLDANDYLDSDGDLVPDYVETFDGTTTSDATSYLDTDDDTVPDYIETRDGTDINNTQSFLDNDLDLVPDYIELQQNTDPTNSQDYLDSDQDGIPDYNEHFQGTDPNDTGSYLDTDGDSISDYLETIYGTDINTPDAIDTDGDGVIDQIEVLQGTDLSDAASFLDTDKDGVPDFVELSQGTSNQNENDYLDSDNDGVPNYTELNQNSDPNDEKSYLDSDGDSVPDSLEVQFGGAIDVADAIDSDGDGVNDYREIYFGVDDAPVWVIDLNNVDSSMSEYYLDVPDEVTEIQLPFVAFELDGQDINYSLAGEDAAQFIVSGEGALSLVSKLSSRNPIDMNSDGIYSLSLIASDGINDSPILLSINLIPSIDTDGDSIFDVYDDDDDNDLVPDDIEIEQGTDPLDSDSYLDEDQNGEADFIQISNAEYINYDFPLGVTIDEGSYAIIDLTQITSVNGSVNIVVNEVDGLNYKFRDNTIYIYADYIEQDTTIELVISMTDGVETIEHTFPISVVNVAIEKAKIELIREAKVIKGALKVQVASKGISNGAEVEYLWYLGDMNNPIIGNDIMELTVNDFIDDVMVVKVEVSADSFETVYSDIIELSRDEFESGQDGNGEESISAENVAGTFSLFAVMLLVVLGAYRRYLSGRALLALLAAISITGCASNNSDNKSTNIALSESIKTIQFSFDDRDPLYQAKLEFEANKERLRKEEEARRIAQEKRERAERTHISTIGF